MIIIIIFKKSLNTLVAVSKGMQAVRICTFRMLHFLTGPASIMLTCIVVINWLLLLLNATPLGRCMKYCGQHVCLSICPLTCLKNRMSVCLWLGLALMRILPGVWMTSCFHIWSQWATFKDNACFLQVRQVMTLF